MRKSLLASLLGIYAAFASATAIAATKPIKITIPCNKMGVKISQQLPLSIPNINAGYQGLSPVLQQCFDQFSWESFAALVWPVGADGKPLKNFTDPSTSTVWETYQGPLEIFSPSDAPVVPQNLKGIPVINPQGKFLQASGQPLLDKNKNFVVFEIKANSVEANYIKSNNLNTKAGQAKATSVDFPESVDHGATSPNSSVGSMEIKAAWRILDPATEDISRFFHKDALIYVKAENSSTGKEMFVHATVGLVGLHVIRKVARFQWIWSTFEQIDNTPDINGLSSNPSGLPANGKGFSFYNANCPMNVCNDNSMQSPAKGEQYKWAASAPYGSNYVFTDKSATPPATYGSQINRTVPVPDYTVAINSTWQSALAKQKSVWSNYRLIGSQWLSHTDGFPSTKFSVPFSLSNMTLESYDQSQFSCVSCHNFATINNGKVNADFSFMLNMAP